MSKFYKKRKESLLKAQNIKISKIFLFTSHPCQKISKARAELSITSSTLGEKIKIKDYKKANYFDFSYLFSLFISFFKSKMLRFFFINSQKDNLESNYTKILKR